MSNTLTPLKTAVSLQDVYPPFDGDSSITSITHDKSEVENSKLPVTKNDELDDVDDKDDKAVHKDSALLSDDGTVVSDVEKETTTGTSYTASREGSDSVLNNNTMQHISVQVTEV